MSIAEQLNKEYYSAIQCLAAEMQRDARNRGDFLGDHAATTLAENEFESAASFSEWVGLVARYQTIT